MYWLRNAAQAIMTSEVPGLPTLSDGDILTNVLNIFYFVVGFVAVIVIILAGFRYATSAGDAGKVSSAKNQILYAVVGLVVIFAAFAITNFVVGRL